MQAITSLTNQTESNWAALSAQVNGDRSPQSRVRIYADWAEQNGVRLLAPDLRGFRDSILAKGKSRATAAAYLSTIRGAYGRLVTDNRTRDSLYAMAKDSLKSDGRTASPADVKAMVDESIVRIQNAIDPEAAKVKIVKRQDIPDSAFLRLTGAEASALIAAPLKAHGDESIKGLRDSALIAVLICTGIRESELIALDVGDLRESLGGEVAVHIREGKGCKSRLVPWGDLAGCLRKVDQWTAAAGIESGSVFRGLYKGGRVRDGRLSPKAIDKIVGAYKITQAATGESVKVKPHDCRRTYARLQYEAGLDPIALKDNLGHGDLKTTLGYIGELGAEARRPKAVVIL